MTHARRKTYGVYGAFAFLLAGNVSAWTPGTYPAPSQGLGVDRMSRNDVLSFWHGVYQASEGFQARLGWAGSYATSPGAEGTIGAAFVTDMERRLNYFRAMSGVPANATMNTASTVVIEGGDAHTPPANTLKSAAAQRAALMLVMNHNVSTGVNPAFTHNPPVNSTWTAVPWNANFRGTIGLNTHGPDAITAYMREADSNSLGSENKDAGHRRWLMRGSATNFATGDIPAFFDPANPSTRRPSANVIYVVQNPSETATVAPAFVTYPTAGFFPAQLNGRFWSLTYPGAGFGSATVSVTEVGGAAVAATIRSRNFAAGDSAITWEVPAAHAATSFPEDRSYDVTVSGITGAGVPPSHSYRFTFINPDKLTSDQNLTGTAAPHPPTPATYTFTPPPFAEALRVKTYREIPVSWIESAEAGAATEIIDRTSGTYPFLSSTDFPISPPLGPIAGSRSYRLTHPTSQSSPDQIFELGRQIMPNAGATLTFRFRRGYMAPASKLALESSSDGGVTWSQLGSTISGVSETMIDSSVSDASIPIPASALPLLIRFRYFTTPGLIYTHDVFPAEPTGIFIDTITVTSADWLEPRKTNELAGTASTFSLNTTTQGGPMVVGEQWHLALQTKLGNRWFPDGPLKSIIPSATPPLTPYQLWVADNPGLTGDFDDDHDGDGIPNGVEFAFFHNPTLPSSLGTLVIAPPGVADFSIRTPLASARDSVLYQAECSESLSGDWTSENVTVSMAGGFLTATAPRPPSGKCFLRWKISLP